MNIVDYSTLEVNRHPTPASHPSSLPPSFLLIDMFEDMNEINDLMGRSYAAPDGLDEVRIILILNQFSTVCGEPA